MCKKEKNMFTSLEATLVQNHDPASNQFIGGKVHSWKVFVMMDFVLQWSFQVTTPKVSRVKDDPESPDMFGLDQVKRISHH